MSAASMVGVGIGLVAGAAAGLLMAPVRGSQMRASLRSQADYALDRGMRLLEEGRRAFRARSVSSPTPAPLTATLGEIAQLRSGTPLPSEARS